MSPSRRALLALAGAVAGLLAAPRAGAEGRTWYVAAIRGSGSGSRADPFTLDDLPDAQPDCLDRGRLPALGPGDTLVFRGPEGGGDGVYPLHTGACYAPRIHAGGDGTAERPITIRAETGERAVLRRASGSGPLVGTVDESGRGQSHVHIRGLAIEYPGLGTGPGEPDAPMLAGSHPGRVAVKLVGGDGVKLLYNRIDHFDHPCGDDCITFDNHAAIWADGATGLEVAYNEIHGPGAARYASNVAGVIVYHTARSRFHDNHVDGAFISFFGKYDLVDVRWERNWASNVDPEARPLENGDGYAGGYQGYGGGDVSLHERIALRHNVLGGAVGTIGYCEGCLVTGNEIADRHLLYVHNLSGMVAEDNLVLVGGDATRPNVVSSYEPYARFDAMFRRLDHNCYVGDGREAPTAAAWAFDLNGRPEALPWAELRRRGREPGSRLVAARAGCAPRAGVPPALRAVVVDASRYGPRALAAAACANGLDDDRDGRTDFPDDPDCASREGAGEGAGSANRAPSIASAGGPHRSVGGATVPLAVTASDPDGDTLLYSWRRRGGACPPWDANADPNTGTRFEPNGLVEDPALLFTRDFGPGRCELEVTVWDGGYDATGQPATDSRAVVVELAKDGGARAGEDAPP